MILAFTQSVKGQDQDKLSCKFIRHIWGQFIWLWMLIPNKKQDWAALMSTKYSFIWKNFFFKRLENNDFFQKFKKFKAKQGCTSGK